MPTLNEIADQAGMSITVVSRVLSPKPELNSRVASRTRHHVLAIAERMGYRPNRNAEFLKRGTTPVIGVFLPRFDDSLVARLTFGISDEASRQNFPVSFHYDMSIESYRSFISNAHSLRNCGIITFPYFETDINCEKLIEDYVINRGRIVMISQSRHMPDITTVRIDDYYGGRLAGECLLSNGCNKVFAYATIVSRADGCADVLRTQGIDCESYMVGASPLETVYARIKASIAGGLRTGVFAGTDRDAAMFYKFADDNGLKIGRDVFVVGYDNQNYSKLLNPALTTIDQPIQDAGCKAVKKLIDLIYDQPVESESFKPVLIKRDSA